MSRKQKKPAADSQQTNQKNVEQLNKTEKEDVHETHVISSLVGSLNEALSEDYKEIEDVMKTEPADKLLAGKSPKKHRFFIIIGIFVIAMSIVGIISTVNFVKESIDYSVNKTALKNEFALFVYPAVAADIPEFDTIENLYPASVINSAIWKIILFGDTSNYAKNGSYMTIPATDVEAAARSIFGTGFDIVHSTTGAGDVRFTYDENTKSYTVLENPTFEFYSPVIKDISNVGETYTVTVEYMPPTAISIEDFEYENDPAKTLVYTISRTDTKSTVRSVAYADVELDDNRY